MDTERLRSWQIEPAQHLLGLLRKGQNVVDCSSTGIGKTFVAAAIAKQLQLPTLVVCPKIAQTQWHEAAAHFDDSLSVVGWEALRTGHTPYGQWQHPLPDGGRDYLQCTSCQLRVDFKDFQPCYAHPNGVHCVEVKKKAHRYGRFSFSPAIRFLVLDEIHKASGLDSLNADIVIAARNQSIPTLGLSATLGTSPLHFRAVGYLLGLHGLRDFDRWAFGYGVKRDPLYRALHWPVGESFKTATMAHINLQIIPARGVRVCADDIPGFPDVDVSASLYDINEPEKLNGIYEAMHEALATLDKRASSDVAPESAITIQLRAQQRVELLKVPLFVELAQDFLEKSFSMGIFVNFQQTIEELAKRLKTDCIVSGRTLKTRQRSIDAFQANDSRLILVNNAAGGLALSLHDLHGGHPRGGLVSPGFSAMVFKQVLGRFPRAGGKSRSFYKVVLAAGTVETKIHKALRAKLNCLDALTDGDLQPDNLAIDNR